MSSKCEYYIEKNVHKKHNQYFITLMAKKSENVNIVHISLVIWKWDNGLTTWRSCIDLELSFLHYRGHNIWGVFIASILLLHYCFITVTKNTPLSSRLTSIRTSRDVMPHVWCVDVMPSMVRFFGDLATGSGALPQGLSAGHLGRRRSTIRRGSETGDTLQHTIHLTSHSSTPSAHESVGDSTGACL